MNKEQIRKELIDIIKAEIWDSLVGIQGYGDAADSIMLFLEPLLKEN